MANNPEANRITVDLARQQISVEGKDIAFTVDKLKKHMLLEGHDAISYTLQYQQEIREFEQRHFVAHPWLLTQD